MKLISNKPIGKNEFPGNERSGIAKHLAEQILSPSNFTVETIDASRVSVIGVEGRWGSGKSNLIAITKRIIADDEKGKDVFFFDFDLWGHQLELTRKAILEELVESLINAKLLEKEEYWRHKVKRLTGVSVEHDKYLTPHLSLVAVIWMVCITLVPVFSLIVRMIESNSPLAWSLAWALPCIAALSYFGIAYWQWDKHGHKGVLGALARAAWLYQKKEVESSTTDFQHECEPTIFSFTKFLRELSADLPKGLKVVLVFDNIDRLPADKVKAFWSSAHILFADCAKETSHRFVTIVPFDRSHIKEAFKEGDNSRDYIGDDYINKTFDVIYRVSAPIMDDWQSYLRGKLKEATHGDMTIGDTNILSIIRVFNIAYPRNLITPRNIISFVNSIVIEHELNPNVEFRALALFAIYRQKLLVENPAPIIVSGEFIDNKELLAEYQSDEGLQAAVAAIVYQVDLEVGKTIALKKALSDALEGGDSEGVAEVSRHSAFPAIFHDVMDSATNLIAVPVALCGIDTTAVDANIIEDCWNTFLSSERIKTLISLRDENPKLDEWAETIVRNASLIAKKRFIRDYMMAHRLSSTPNISLYMSRASLINEIVKDEGFVVGNVVEAKSYYLRSDVKQIVDTAPRRYEDCGVAIDLKNFDEAVVNDGSIIRSPQTGLWLLNLKEADAIRLKATREHLSNHQVNAQTQQSIANAKATMQLLDYITPDDEKINTGITSGILTNCINNQVEDESLRYLLIAELFKRNHELRDVNVELMVKAFMRVMTFDDLLCAFNDSKGNANYCKCVDLAFRENYKLEREDSLALIIRNLPEFCQLTGLPVETIMSKIDDADTERLLNADWLNIASFEGVKILVASNNVCARMIVDKIRNSLETMGDEDWNTMLLSGDESKSIQLLPIVRAALSREKIWKAYGEVERILDGTLTTLPNKNNWRVVFGILFNNPHCGGDIKDRFRLCVEADETRALNKKQFIFLGEAILQNLDLSRMKHGLNKILTSNGVREDPSCQEIYLRYPDSVKTLFDCAEHKEDFVLFLKNNNAADEGSRFNVLASLIPES